jgi:acyl carrier protein
MAALRAQARDGRLPAILRGIVRGPARRASARTGGSLIARLADVPEPDREAAVLELIHAEIARVLGNPPGESVDAHRPFKELGFDSLAALQLRNGLQAASGMPLPATLAFDHPTAAEVARHLMQLVEGSGSPETDRVRAELDRLELLLPSVSADEPQRASVVSRLQSLLSKLQAPPAEDDGASVEADLDDASDEDLFAIVDRKRGA